MDEYRLANILAVEPEKVREYWEDVKAKDLLKYRIPETLNPTVNDAMEMVVRMRQSTFAVLDSTGRMIGECMLENFQGLCAMSHFSVRPEAQGSTAVAMAKSTISQLFSLKRSTDKTLPYIESLLGLTPLSNKLALRFARNIGYRKLCVIPNSYWLAYKQKFEDAQLSILEAPHG